MGCAQAAFRPSLDRSCSLDRFAAQNVLDDGKRLRALRPDAARTGGVLPAAAGAAPPSNDEENSEDENREVVLRELWYRLSEEERVRFGGCFSRMILKMLNRCGGLSGEDVA